MRQNKTTSKIVEKPPQSDPQYEIEILWSTHSETTFLSIDQIVDICRKHDLWSIQNGRLVQPELIAIGIGKVILSPALVGG